MQDKAKIPMLKIAVIIKKSGLEVSFPNPGQENPSLFSPGVRLQYSPTKLAS